MKRYSKEGLEKRKAKRKCLKEFFEKHVNRARNSRCEECGERLIGDVSEIAHIVPKNYFESIMCNDANVMLLCGKYSKNQCHTNYDSFSDDKVREMKIFPFVKTSFEVLKEDITEKLNYKLTQRYE